MSVESEIVPEMMPAEIRVHVAMTPKLVRRFDANVPMDLHGPLSHMSIEVPDTPMTGTVNKPTTAAKTRAAMFGMFRTSTATAK